MRWVQARDVARRVRAIPSQQPDVVEQYGLTRAQTDREVWAIDASGRSFAGAAAVNRVLAELGGVWLSVARLYRLAPVRWIEDRVYRWVAEHRALFRFWSTTPECEQPGVRCS